MRATTTIDSNRGEPNDRTDDDRDDENASSECDHMGHDDDPDTARRQSRCLVQLAQKQSITQHHPTPHLTSIGTSRSGSDSHQDLGNTPGKHLAVPLVEPLA